MVSTRLTIILDNVRIKQRARKVKTRAIFVDGISGPGLKMLGTM